MKNGFSFKALSQATFCAFAIKLLIIQDISAFQALSLLIAASFVAFYEYKASISQLKETKSQLDALKVEFEGLRSVQKDIITNLSTVKTAMNMKSQSTRNY
jgi:hypothetical protein